MPNALRALALCLPLAGCTIVEEHYHCDTGTDVTTDTDTTDTDSTDTDTTDTDTTPAGDILTDGVYYILYSAWPLIGIDQRPDVDATFDPDGAMLTYLADPVWEAPDFTAMTHHDVYATGTTGIGRHSDGDMTGNFNNVTPLTFTADEGFHYALTQTEITTGPFGKDGEYTLISNTTPTTFGSNGLGTLDHLSIDVVAGDPPQFDVDLQVTVAGEAYTYQSGSYTPLQSGPNFQHFGSGATEAGSLCQPNCTPIIYGVFAEDHDLMMVAWQFMGTDRISGVALLHAP